MKLSIVMPVYNEIGTIAKIIQQVGAAPVNLLKELILVDDASTDGTRACLERLTRLGCWIYEVPISYHGRSCSEGKKIGGRE